MQNLSPGNVGLAGGLFIAGGLLAFMDESLKSTKRRHRPSIKSLLWESNDGGFQQGFGQDSDPRWSWCRCCSSKLDGLRFVDEFETGPHGLHLEPRPTPTKFIPWT